MNDNRFYPIWGAAQSACDPYEHEWDYVGDQKELRLFATCTKCKGLTPNQMMGSMGYDAMKAELKRRREARKDGA